MIKVKTPRSEHRGALIIVSNLVHPVYWAPFIVVASGRAERARSHMAQINPMSKSRRLLPRSRRRMPTPRNATLIVVGDGRCVPAFVMALPVERRQPAAERPDLAIADGHAVHLRHRQDATGGAGDEHLVRRAQRLW